MASNALQRHIIKKGAYPKLFTTRAKNVDFKLMQKMHSFQVAGERLDKLRQSYDEQKPYTSGAMELNFASVRNSADVANDENQIKAIFNVGAHWILEMVEKNWLKSNENDLIINMTKMGTVITSTSEMLMIAAILASVVGSVIKSNFLLKFVSSLTGGGGILATITGILTPIVVMGLLVGVIMQFVLPAIPLIKWLVAVQSWGIMLFVAMIYAPIWMMSTAAASNEDWVNDKVKDGFIMLAELVLRPFLMAVSFYIAMKLMMIANLAAKIMFTYMIGLANEGVMGFISIAMVLVITTFVAYKLTMRTFDIIAEVPDWVIERMGGKPMGDAVKDDTANSTVLIAGKATGEVTSGFKGIMKK